MSLLTFFAPVNKALRPGVRTARADGHPQPKATTFWVGSRMLRLRVRGKGCVLSCRHPQSQFSTGRDHMVFGHFVLALCLRELFGLIAQAFGR